MVAKQMYCRKASEFDVFRDFDPTEFKYLKFIIEREYFLTSISRGYISRALLHDFRLYQYEVQHGPGGVVLFNYLESIISRFMNNNEGEETLGKWRKELRKEMAKEEKKIFRILDESGYIRKDCIHQSVLIASLVNDALPIKLEEDGLFSVDWVSYMEGHLNRFYETIKPVTGKELSLISEVLSDELTSSQYGLMKHYIFKGWKTNYIYTSAEYEVLKIALKNIQASQFIKSKINEIMDNTLF